MIKKLYKFRKLETCKDLERIEDILENGFYCNGFFDFNDFNEGVYINSKDTLDITFSKKLEYKICSFSAEEALNKELMWGHYCGAGKGVAIEIELDNGKDIEKVIYDDDFSCTSLKEILTHKTKDWVYEAEHRYLSKDPKKNHAKIGKIVKIYFGTPYENLSNSEEIIKKSKSLQKYHKLRDQLKMICDEQGIKHCDYTLHS